MAIIDKRNATIIARSTASFDLATFDKFEMPFIREVSAETVLAEIQPKEFDFLPGEKFIAYDTETFAYAMIANNLLPHTVQRRWIKGKSKYIPNDFPFCISISDGTNSFVVYDTVENKFAEFKKLLPLLTDTSISKIAHNFDFDMHISANAGLDLKGRLHDTMHLSKLTRVDAFTHNLFDVTKEAVEYVDLNGILVFERMLDSYKAAHKITDYRQFPRRLMTQYTGADTWNALICFEYLYPRMLESDLFKLYEIESQMLIVAYKMERRGIKLDKDYKNVLIPELMAEVESAERRIYETAGTAFNINSSPQLLRVMEKLGYASLVKYNKPTPAMLAKGIVKGNPSFDKVEMERLEEAGVPLIKDILAYRKAEKLLNTFAIKLYDLCDATDTVHCNINTIEAKTGRFSISVPSMQNIPRRGDKRVRGAFIAPEDYELYDFDFKSQEAIVMAHYSRSPYLLEIIGAGGDIHKAVASIIYTLDYDEVDKALREIAKSVEFAIVYGAGAPKVAQMTGLSLGDAMMAMKQFMRNAPEVDIFIRTANKIGKERGYIKTVLGRIVKLEKNREYACVNYLCQGSSADSTKSRMVVLHKFLAANNFKTFMSLQVHDSLLQNVHKEEKHILGWLRWLQTERELFRVPITVDVALCSPTWREKDDIEVAAVEPPVDLMEKMNNYNIWAEGLMV